MNRFKTALIMTTMMAPALSQAGTITGFEIIDTKTQKSVSTLSASLTSWTLNKSSLPLGFNIKVDVPANITMVRSQLLDAAGDKKRQDGTNYQIDDKKAPFAIGSEKGGVYAPMTLNQSKYSLRVFAYQGATVVETKVIAITVNSSVVATPTPKPTATPKPAPTATPSPTATPVPPVTGAGYQFPSVSTKVSAGVIQLVPTFNAMSVYFKTANGSESQEALVRYRISGASAWSQAQSLAFDPRATSAFPSAYASAAEQYRGSIVQLAANTAYDVQVMLFPSGEIISASSKTWSETFPVAQTVQVSSSSSTLTLNNSGSASGYLKYQGPATLDAGGASTNNIVINGSYIIVSGLTLKNAGRDAILLGPNAHDIIIENNDISGFGRVAPDAQAKANNFGLDLDAGISNGVYDNPKNLRLIIQHNVIHSPRTTANFWDTGRQDYITHSGDGTTPTGAAGAQPHPIGPQGITLTGTGGQNVIRFNSVVTDENHRWNDGMGGGGNNFGYPGFPGPDSDIYGNQVAGASDDGIEAEGGGMNDRVYANSVERAYKGIAISAVTVGPMYIFRNVVARGRRTMIGDTSGKGWNNGTAFIKAQERTEGAYFAGRGRIYIYNNTVMAFSENGLNTGFQNGIDRMSSRIFNMVTRNNIIMTTSTAGLAINNGYQTCKAPWTMISGLENSFDYDLQYAGFAFACDDGTQEAHALKGVASFANSAMESTTGIVSSAPLVQGSVGQDQGEVIPNFTDGYYGKAPDMGAQELGAPVLKFGSNQ